MYAIINFFNLWIWIVFPGPNSLYVIWLNHYILIPSIYHTWRNKAAYMGLQLLLSNRFFLNVLLSYIFFRSSIQSEQILVRNMQSQALHSRKTSAETPTRFNQVLRSRKLDILILTTSWKMYSELRVIRSNMLIRNNWCWFLLHLRGFCLLGNPHL